MSAERLKSRGSLATAEAADDLVRFIERVGPSHSAGLEALAGLSLSARQGDEWSYIKIDFELSCGPASIKFGTGEMNLSLRSCTIEITRHNCDLLPHKRYEYILSEGGVSHKEEELTASAKTMSGTAEVGAEAKAGLLSGFSVTGFFRGKARAARQSSTDKKTKQVRDARVELIVTAGQDRWRIGDPVHGDVRRSDRKLLGSYFGERKGPDGEALPLCVVARRDRTDDVEVTVRALAPITQLIVEEAQTGEEISAAITQNQLRRRAATALKSHGNALKELRERVAGMVIGHALVSYQQEVETPPSEGHVVIGLATLRLMKEAGAKS